MHKLTVRLKENSLEEAISLRKHLLHQETWAIRFVKCQELVGPHALVEILLTFENLPMREHPHQRLHTIELSGGKLSMGCLEFDLPKSSHEAIAEQIAERFRGSRFALIFELVKGNLLRHIVHCPFTAIGLKRDGEGYLLKLSWQREDVHPIAMLGEFADKVGDIEEF